MLPSFSGYHVLPARDRLDTDARGAKAAHPRHFVTSHARTVIVDSDISLGLTRPKRRFLLEEILQKLASDKIERVDNIII